MFDKLTNIERYRIEYEQKVSAIRHITEQEEWDEILKIFLGSKQELQEGFEGFKGKVLDEAQWQVGFIKAFLKMIADHGGRIEIKGKMPEKPKIEDNITEERQLDVPMFGRHDAIYSKFA